MRGHAMPVMTQRNLHGSGHQSVNFGGGLHVKCPTWGLRAVEPYPLISHTVSRQRSAPSTGASFHGLSAEKVMNANQEHLSGRFMLVPVDVMKKPAGKPQGQQGTPKICDHEGGHITQPYSREGIGKSPGKYNSRVGERSGCCEPVGSGYISSHQHRNRIGLDTQPGKNRKNEPKSCDDLLNPL